MTAPDLRAAVAEITWVTPEGVDWIEDDLSAPFVRNIRPHIATILNGAASGDLVLRADVDGLVEAAKWLRATAQSGFRTADFHRGECSCPRCAEDALFVALTALENRK